MGKLLIEFGGLPPSNNKYLIPTATIKGGKAYPSVYESKESKEFKRVFKGYLTRLVKNKDWDIEQTAEGHWYLDCVFVQSRTNQDSNNFFKVLLDSMTGIVFKDDKNILVRVQKVAYNSGNPRFYLALHKADYTGVFKNDNELKEFQDSCQSCSRYRNGSCSILKAIKENREVSELELLNDRYACSEFKQKKS